MFDGRQGDMGIAGAPQTTKLILLVVWKKFVNRTLEAALMAYRPGKPCGAYVSRNCDLRPLPLSLLSKLTLATTTVNFSGT